jgi:hypothetical protein
MPNLMLQCSLDKLHFHAYCAEASTPPMIAKVVTYPWECSECKWVELDYSDAGLKQTLILFHPTDCAASASKLGTTRTFCSAIAATGATT